MGAHKDFDIALGNSPSRAAQAKATIYAAKEIGVSRLVEVVAARPIDRLLPEAGYLVPHDLVDLTRGEYLTFFVGKGYGFLPQHTPFCPELHAALATAVRAADPAGSCRGIFAALDSWEGMDEGRVWGGHLAGLGVSPAAFLARELELCYAPLCVLGSRDNVEAVVDRMLDELPGQCQCACGSAM